MRLACFKVRAELAELLNLELPLLTMSLCYAAIFKLYDDLSRWQSAT